MSVAAKTRPRSAKLEANGFERQRIVDIQRSRLLAAMADACCEHGAGNVTVSHVVERAGVSRRTFYELFADREDCFLAAFEDAVARASQRILGAYDVSKPWATRIRSSLVALLAFIDEERSMGRLLIVESLGAGPEALARRQRTLAPLIAVLDEGSRQAKNDAPSPLTAEGIVGGVLGVLHARLSERRSRPVLDLAGPLMGMIVLPYLGAAASRREMARPVPPVASSASRGSDARRLKQLRMRLTYRTIRVLTALAASPGASNRQVADAAGIVDQGQISKLLGRLQRLGLIENAGTGGLRGEPNAWTLTSEGWGVHGALASQIASQ